MDWSVGDLAVCVDVGDMRLPSGAIGCAGEKGVTRFWNKVDRRSPDECWPWTAARNSKGYGRFSYGGKARRAHRVAWELTHGPIPTGLCLDHLCRNPGCVNPDHLEAVTIGENTRRGTSSEVLSEKFASMTHCRRGHEFTPENTQVLQGTNYRRCRACNAIRKRSAKLRRQELADA